MPQRLLLSRSSVPSAAFSAGRCAPTPTGIIALQGLSAVVGVSIGHSGSVQLTLLFQERVCDKSSVYILSDVTLPLSNTAEHRFILLEVAVLTCSVFTSDTMKCVNAVQWDVNSMLTQGDEMFIIFAGDKERKKYKHQSKPPTQGVASLKVKQLRCHCDHQRR